MGELVSGKSSSRARRSSRRDVLRAHGLRVVIFTNDHQPAHVHVIGDGEAKINLLGADGSPELIWADAMSRGEVRRAPRIVTEQQTLLLARWEDIHGRPD